MDFRDRHVVVTGGAGALGGAVVERLIEAGAVKGKTLTSWPSLRTDLANAGATWVDEVVRRAAIRSSTTVHGAPIGGP